MVFANTIIVSIIVIGIFTMMMGFVNKHHLSVYTSLGAVIFAIGTIVMAHPPILECLFCI